MRADKEKKERKNTKRFRRSLCVILLAVGLAATGLSLAYFTSHDRTTNRAASDYTNSLSIVLTEPTWDSTGELEAQETVAGKEIDKDPYVTNYMATYVYVRLKIEFSYTDANGNEKSVPWSTGTTLTKFDYNEKNCTVTTANAGDTYSRFLATIYYPSTSSDNHLLAIDTSGATSINPYFYYDDGWFYYVDSDGTNPGTALQSLAYKEKTAVPLFTKVKLPVFDAEYNDLFLNGFQITVKAEAVDVAAIDSTAAADISNKISTIKDVFEKGTTLNTGGTAKYDDDTVINNFTPAKVSVEVKETVGSNETMQQTGVNSSLNWGTPTNNKYTADKEVRIHCDDASDVTDCYVRVCLLPKWESSITPSGATDSTYFEVLDNENIAADKNDIVFPDSSDVSGNTFIIDGVTFTLAETFTTVNGLPTSTNWIYKDGYFYYRGILSPGEDTPALLKSVSIAQTDLDAHATDGETLGISVLADAIQADGGAVEQKWNVTLSK